MRISRHRTGGDRSRPCPFWGSYRIIYGAGISRDIAGQAIARRKIERRIAFGGRDLPVGLHKEVAI